MPISHCEHMPLICPDCRASFHADVWLILDAQEQPAQAEALRQGQFNRVTCPHCQHSGAAGTPFLFHDNAARCVIFAMPAATEEFVWREQARDLHSILVGSIPPEERRPYLADVQIAQGTEGIAHSLQKAARRQAAQSAAVARAAPADTAQAAQAPAASRILQPEPPPTAPPPAASPPADLSSHDEDALYAAIEALIAASTARELDEVLQQHPLLSTPVADSSLQQLADVAFEQRDYELAESLGRARRVLAKARAGTNSEQMRAEFGSVAAVAPPAGAQPPAPVPDMPDMPDEVYRALLQAQSPQELAHLCQAYPPLLQPALDAILVQQIDQLAAEGHTSLALRLLNRHESLVALRQQGMPAAEPPAAPAVRPPSAPPPDTESIAQEAVEALLVAGDDETLARVLIDYPVLLTEEAQQVLWQLSADARSHGDEELAAYAVECRAMLRKVREGLSNT